MNWMKNLGCKCDAKPDVQCGSPEGSVQLYGSAEGSVRQQVVSWRVVPGLIGSALVNLWILAMVTVFPLYAPDRYFDLGAHKFQFFFKCSLWCLLPAAVLFVLQAVGCLAQVRRLDMRQFERQSSVKERKLSGTDLAFLAYLAVLAGSFVSSDYRQQAWIGAEGWYMGFRTQLLLAAAWFCVSRAKLWTKVLLAGHFTGSAAAALLGILHRFGADPLRMYEGISEKYYLEFLSTLGQATWFSSYLCTVLVIGAACFFLEQNGRKRFFYGIYCAVMFGAVVTQNSDSAFLAMAVLAAGLFWICCFHTAWMERFLEFLLLMLGSFKVIGILQLLLPAQAMQLGALSVFMTQSMETWYLLLAVSVIYTLFQAYKGRIGTGAARRIGRVLFGTTAAAAGISVVGGVLFIICNTAGVLPVQNSNSYLLFDDAWGNYRGVIWKVSGKMFAKMDIWQKLTGAGPDCYWPQCEANTGLREQIAVYFGWDQVLTNAHNEFLNVLICLGVLGLLAYAAYLVTAFVRFLKGALTWKEPVLLAGCLVILTYCSHNLFCYQQVCCTPFLILILAIAENRRRDVM